MDILVPRHTPANQTLWSHMNEDLKWRSDAYRNSKAILRCPRQLEMEYAWLQTRAELGCGHTDVFMLQGGYLEGEVGKRAEAVA